MASVIEGSGIQGAGYGVKTEDSGKESKASEFAHAGKEQAKRIGGITRDRVYHQVDSKKEELAKGLHGLADTLEGAKKGGNLGITQPLVDSAVQVLHRVSDRIERGSTEELLRDAQAQVRERPGIFIAGCVAIGFLVGRVLKS